jgi:hypothetical protein
MKPSSVVRGNWRFLGTYGIFNPEDGGGIYAEILVTLYQAALS